MRQDNVPSVRVILLALFFVTLMSSNLAAGSEQLNWPTYGFDYANTRHVDTNGINRSNVAHVVPAWRFVLGPHERVETTPIVLGRTMYVSTGFENNVVAIDAVTGKQKWRYRPQLGKVALCCGTINRGVAVAANRVFIATLDGRLLALDAVNGKPLWSVRIGNPDEGFSETIAPLTWNGMVLIGSSGSDFGVRGSFSAYRAGDGRLLWRWYAVSSGWEGSYAATIHGVSLHRDIAREKRDASRYRNAWLHGGGAPWLTPALDARTGTLYISTANPSPVFNGSVRPGDNLYTDSVVALDARTGKMEWYKQLTPHDVWEYEPSPPMLFDARDARGRRIPAVGVASKTAWYYILDRRNGMFLRLSDRLAPNGHVYDAPDPDEHGKYFPIRGIIGPGAYDPQRHLSFITSADTVAACFIAAVAVDNGKIVWKKMLTGPHAGVFGGVVAGALSTPELVFVSSTEGQFAALDAATGASLWQYDLGATAATDGNAGLLQRIAHRVRDWLLPLKRRFLHQEPPPVAMATVNENPVLYEVDGREYVAIGFDSKPERAVGGAVLYVFALPQH